MQVSGWSVERTRGSAGLHHGRPVPDGAGRSVWVLEVDRPAVVLGSTQPEHDVDHGAAEALGVEVVRRRSGGGAVLLDPGEALWVDVVVPRDDPLWDDDVAVAAEWLGHVWAAALADLGIGPAEVHRGGLVRTPLAPVVCFAGTGPGEVRVEGRKVLGISQRRTRHAARFQCSLPLVWRPGRHVALLAPGIARVAGGLEPERVVGDLPVLAVGRVDGGAAGIVEALLARLPGATGREPSSS